MNKEKKLFLTFDLDWVNDTVLEWFYSVIKEYDLSATIFVTHETKWLQTLRNDKKIELGIHPNFNDLLTAQTDNSRGFADIIRRMKELVPEAVSYRSHSLTVNTPIIRECVKQGILYDLNMYVNPNHEFKLTPFQRSGITILPFIYEDDLWLLESKKAPVEYYLQDSFSMIRIFNFHPIHLFLNCEDFNRYEDAKLYTNNPKELKKYRNPLEHQNGIYNFFLALIKNARENGYSFGLIKDISQNPNNI